jgi:hypothetical protein
VSDNLSGSDDIPAEMQRVMMVPPSQVADKTAAHLAWEDALLKEAGDRILRRTLLFWWVSIVISLLFGLFVGHVAWLHLQAPSHKIDHLLLWLLAAFPLGLTFVMIKLTADPHKNEPVTTWPDQVVKLGERFIDTIADIAQKKLG